MGWKKQKQQPIPTKEPPKPKDITDLPSGTVIVTPEGKRFYISGQKKFRIISDRVFYSWDFPREVFVTQACANRYKTFGRLGFREGAVVRDFTSSTLYLISENKKRRLTTPDALTNLNIDESKIITMSEEEAGLHEGGEPL